MRSFFREIYTQEISTRTTGNFEVIGYKTFLLFLRKNQKFTIKQNFSKSPKTKEYSSLVKKYFSRRFMMDCPGLRQEINSLEDKCGLNNE